MKLRAFDVIPPDTTVIAAVPAVVMRIMRHRGNTVGGIHKCRWQLTVPLCRRTQAESAPVHGEREGPAVALAGISDVRTSVGVMAKLTLLVVSRRTQ